MIQFGLILFPENQQVEEVHLAASSGGCSGSGRHAAGIASAGAAGAWREEGMAIQCWDLSTQCLISQDLSRNPEVTRWENCPAGSKTKRIRPENNAKLGNDRVMFLLRRNTKETYYNDELFRNRSA